jgi:hypothetical protein
MAETLETRTSTVIDTIQGFFEKCTNDLQNPQVREVMETFKRKGLQEINFYGNRNLAVFTQLEPIMRRARESIESLVKDNIVTENDADVVNAKQCIENMYTCILTEIRRGISLNTQQPGMSALLMKLKIVWTSIHEMV